MGKSNRPTKTRSTRYLVIQTSNKTRETKLLMRKTFTTLRTRTNALIPRPTTRKQVHRWNHQTTDMNGAWGRSSRST
eukprot:13225093-Heterocapsa_arctica.AAC.1